MDKHKYPTGYKLRLADIEKVAIWKYLRRNSINHLKEYEDKLIDLNNRLLYRGSEDDRRFNGLKSLVYLSNEFKGINDISAEELSVTVIQMLGFEDRAEPVLKLCRAFKYQHGQNIEKMIKKIVYG